MHRCSSQYENRNTRIACRRPCPESEQRQRRMVRNTSTCLRFVCVRSANIAANMDEKVDPKTNRKYYLNSRTGEGSWTRRISEAPPINIVAPSVCKGVFFKIASISENHLFDLTDPPRFFTLSVTAMVMMFTLDGFLVRSSLLFYTRLVYEQSNHKHNHQNLRACQEGKLKQPAATKGHVMKRTAI